MSNSFVLFSTYLCPISKYFVSLHKDFQKDFIKILNGRGIVCSFSFKQEMMLKVVFVIMMT